VSLEPARHPESRIPVSPQMALRVAALGTFALIMFGIIFFRLWYLQILTGTHYVRQVGEEQTRTLPIPAPRGEILARNGHPLVSSRPTSAVQVVPSELPPGIGEQVARYEERLKAAAEKEAAAERQLKVYEGSLSAGRGHLTRHARHELRRLQAAVTSVPAATVPPLAAADVRLHSLFRRLGRVLRLPPRAIDERVVRGVVTTRYAPVTIDSSAGAGPRTVLLERQNDFPGVVAQPVSTREYPFGEMAAQIFGHVGPVSEEELESGPYKHIERDTIVGQNGLEYYYDKYLRGKAGSQKVQVNAAGEPLAGKLAPIQPHAGYDLRLSLDPGLQMRAEKAVREEIALANAAGRPADGAAFVAMSPLNGEIYAMGSYPTYNPGVFTKPISDREYNALFGKGTPPPSGGQPLLNRATEGGYPVGSTFKPIVAIGAMESGVLNPYESLGGGTCIEEGGQRFCNAENAGYAATDLVHALEESSDTYFYTVGKMAFSHGPVLQRMAERLGIAKPTGVDLPSELPGVVPDEKWLKELERAEARCTRENHGARCGYVEEPNELWTVGQNMILAVGQGNLLTSPLQMAVAYSALADAFRTGGQATIVTPHLGTEIDEPGGGLVQSLASRYPPRRRFHLNPTYVNLIFEGIHDATTGPAGTSTNVWQGWNQQLHPTYGKTGTAERVGQETQSWYMCYIASETHPIVMAITIEQGGYGDQAAAPVARQMADQWFGESFHGGKKG
jgi:penicillin-binding protein 2